VNSGRRKERTNPALKRGNFGSFLFLFVPLNRMSVARSAKSGSKKEQHQNCKEILGISGLNLISFFCSFLSRKRNSPFKGGNKFNWIAIRYPPTYISSARSAAPSSSTRLRPTGRKRRKTKRKNLFRNCFRIFSLFQNRFPVLWLTFGSRFTLCSAHSATAGRPPHTGRGDYILWMEYKLQESRNLAAINLCKFTAKFLDSCYRVLSYLDLSYSPIWFFPTIMVSSRQKTKLETRGSHRLVTYLPSPPVIKVWRWRWKEGRLKACI